MKALLAFLAALVLKTSAKTVQLTPLANVDTFSLYKNSNFTAICPTVDFVNNQANKSKVQTAYARSQSEFCSHLNPAVDWFIVPTNTTPAAYLPNWSSTLIDLASLTGIAFYHLIKLIQDSSKDSVGKSFYVLATYSIGSLIFWWYSAISGFANHLHASWINPIAWLTPYSLCFQFINFSLDELMGDCASGCAAVLMVIIGIFSWLMSMAYVSARVALLRLGAGSYIPLDPFPVSLHGSFSASCQQLLQDPSSHIYSDPTRVGALILHIIIYWGMLPALTLCWCFVAFDHAPGLILAAGGIPLQLMAVIWMSVVARRGTPFMFLEECGVVVIAMSPKSGYWDARVHDHGYNLQAVRAIFGL